MEGYQHARKAGWHKILPNLLKERYTIHIRYFNGDLKNYKLQKRQPIFSPSNLVVQTLAGNFNKQMISHQTALFDKLEPLIALTKLDSVNYHLLNYLLLFQQRAQITLLTGTKSIVGAIAIASEAILSQYLKTVELVS